MKISDEISLSARNLLRRKGRTALTLVGVVIGTCMVVLMISLGIAQTKTNEEMLQSWGDLTQVQIYGYGTMVGSDGKPLYLDDAAIANIKQIPHVAAATPYAQAYNLEGTITAGRNDRYTMDISNLIGIDPTALEPMGFALQSGSWPANTPASEKAAKLQILVGGSTVYEFQDSRKSYNSPKRYRWQGQTDANGKVVKRTGLVAGGAAAGRVELFREMTDFRRAGEIEGVCIDPVTQDLLVLNNRGTQIILGMSQGPFKDEGYTKEIHEVYIYEKIK